MFVFLKHAFSSGVLDMKRPTRTEERRVIKRSHSVSLARLWWFAASVSRDKENEQPQFTVVHKLHGRAPLLCVVISADAFNLEYESERPGSDSIFQRRIREWCHWNEKKQNKDETIVRFCVFLHRAHCPELSFETPTDQSTPTTPHSPSFQLKGRISQQTPVELFFLLWY